MHKNNIFPACIDYVKCDNTKRPPVEKSHSRGTQEANNFVDKVSFLIQTNYLFHVQIAANEDTIEEHARTKLGHS
jgi:hypothetical protein